MKKMSVLTVTVLLLGLVLFLVRCGSSSSGGGTLPVDVFYQVNGNTISNNANTTVDNRDPISGTDTKVLTWFCGNYQGNQRQKVVLTFKLTNNTWVLDNTSISGGSCG